MVIPANIYWSYQQIHIGNNNANWLKLKTVKTDQVDHSNDEDSSFELIVAEELVYTGKTHLAKSLLANLKKEKINCCRS